jgi:hypothetical protein
MPGPAVTDEELNERFGYHPATQKSAPEHAAVRMLFLETAKQVRDMCPPGRDLSLALTELQSAMHWTNSAIAMQNPLVDDPERARV